MPKQGIHHDYDLQANAEESAKKESACLICGEIPTYRWTDYSGEAICCNCGTPYQLKCGGDEKEKEGKYPYLNIKDEWIPVLKEYWDETKKFTYNGTSFSEKTGLEEFHEWLKEKHPDLIKKQ